MSRVCEICKKGPMKARKYARRGLAKWKGGVGIKTTGITSKRKVPNIQRVRIVEENGTVRTVKVCAKCLKTGLRRGTIRKAVRHHAQAAPAAVVAALAEAPPAAELQPGDASKK